MASFGAVTMLIIEFVLGMIYNLYGTAPTASKSIGLFSSPVLALHVVMSIRSGCRLSVWPRSSRPASRAWGSPATVPPEPPSACPSRSRSR
jgi:hypothetical protein